MQPVVTPEEMKAIDAAAPEPVEVLVERAGAAVARAVLGLLGGGYGRRVVVVAGKGNNGADGRAAARRLGARGVHALVLDAASAPARLPASDAVVDAAYGTGFRGEYRAPDAGGSPVVAVDIPSGVDGLTGQAGEGAVRAGRTVTFAARKPGLLLGDGPVRAGRVSVADIGLDVSSATAWLVEDADLAWLPPAPRESHKWKTAVYVVAGSAGMEGAADLCSAGAMRAGAGTARLAVPGVLHRPRFPEVVGRSVPGTGWDGDVLEDAARVKALVVGPGLARADSTADAVRGLVAKAPVPVVVDADGLFALGTAEAVAEVVRHRPAATVLTPHDGEMARMTGAPPPPDRLGAARDLARRTGAIVLLKGSTTVVAEPGGRALLSDAGDARLASAGTGDVLAGVIAAFLAQGLDPLRAAGLAAHAHGRAGNRGPSRGLVASDLLEALPAVLSGRPS